MSEWKPNGYIIDENLTLSDMEIKMFPDCINSIDKFKRGAPDEEIINWCINKNYIIVTRDIRMTILSLIAKVPILFVNEDYNVVSLIRPDKVQERVDDDIYKHFKERINGTV